LLSITINFKQPELESRKTALLEEEERLKISLAEFEKNLLEELANSEGNLLENKALIEQLKNKTKQSSMQVETSLDESRKLQQSLDQQREVYRDFARIGANLFMVVGDLIKLNNMYQFSLAAFVKLFRRALETEPQASSIEEKLQFLSNSLIRLCYSEIGRSLFKADRLTYSLHFVKGIFGSLITEQEWAFFDGSAVCQRREEAPRCPGGRRRTGRSSSPCSPTPSRTWSPCSASTTRPPWGQFASSNKAEMEIPAKASKLSSFQKLLLVQVFRPDRLESGMNNFVKEAFGGQSVKPTPFSLSHLYEHETTCTDPILFIASPWLRPLPGVAAVRRASPWAQRRLPRNRDGRRAERVCFRNPEASRREGRVALPEELASGHSLAADPRKGVQAADTQPQVQTLADLRAPCQVPLHPPPDLTQDHLRDAPRPQEQPPAHLPAGLAVNPGRRHTGAGPLHALLVPRTHSGAPYLHSPGLVQVLRVSLMVISRPARPCYCR